MVASAGTTPGETNVIRQTVVFHTNCRTSLASACSVGPTYLVDGTEGEAQGCLSTGAVLQIQETDSSRVVVAHTFNPSTREAAAGE